MPGTRVKGKKKNDWMEQSGIITLCQFSANLRTERLKHLLISVGKFDFKLIKVKLGSNVVRLTQARPCWEGREIFSTRQDFEHGTLLNRWAKMFKHGGMGM